MRASSRGIAVAVFARTNAAITAWWIAAALLLVGGCSGTGSREGGGDRGAAISALELFPRSATQREGNGSAYVLGTFEAAQPAVGGDLALALDGAPLAPDFSEVQGTSHVFAVVLPTSNAATFTLTARLVDARGGSSNALSREFRVTADLDSAFGSGGVVIHDDVRGSGGVNEEARTVAIQADGRIVVGGVAGRGMVERYLADGAPDVSFGAGGRQVFSNDSAAAEVRAIALQPDGRIIAAGTGRFAVNDGPQAMLLRLVADGSLDPAFGSGGIASTSFHYDAAANAVALQPDGKIVIAGSVSTGTDVEALVARYGPDGALDLTFGTAGLFRYSAPAGGWDELFGITVDAAGRVLVTGSSSHDSVPGLPELLVLRLTADGALDASFGSGGAFRFALLYDTGVGVAVQPGGRIVVGGGAWSYAMDANVALAIGITPAGALDPTFADNGVFWSRPLAPYGMYGTGFAMSPAGEPVLAGYRANDAVIIRLTPDGALDTSFSADGFAAASSGGIAHGAALAIEPHGEVVVAGWSSFHDQYSDEGVLLARFLAPPR